MDSARRCSLPFLAFLAVLAATGCNDNNIAGNGDDCRVQKTLCPASQTCDYLTGKCVDPQTACTLTGQVERCGQTEFPNFCGPGSTCDQASAQCLATPECKQVICDVTGICRGTDCTLSGGQVSALSLTAPAMATAGAKASVPVMATVVAQGLCGLNVSFEIQGDKEIFVSAFGDQAIWRVGFDGTRTVYLQESAPVNGLTTDRNGTLYYVLPQQKQINRVVMQNGQPVSQKFAGPISTTGQTDLARITFGPDGLLYLVEGPSVHRIDAGGQDTVLAAATLKTSPDGLEIGLAGLAFDKDGALIAGTAARHYPASVNLYRLPPRGTTLSGYVDAGSLDTGLLNPWNEGMALSPDGLITVGVFPATNTGGFIYQVQPGGPTAQRLRGLAEIQKGVPATQYAGIHGLAYGADGSLYFANQNTPSATNQPDGQVLALRPDGNVELLTKGLNFDWDYGLDGDLVVSRQTVATASAPIRDKGVAQTTLDAPTVPGSYQIRALITDPKTGAILEARRPLRVQ